MCVTAVEKPSPSRVLSSPTPENIQVRGDGALRCQSRPGKGGLAACGGVEVGDDWEISLELSSSFCVVFFPFDSSLGSSFSHWTLPLFPFGLFVMCILVCILK